MQSRPPEDVDKKSEKPIWNPADILQNTTSPSSSPTSEWSHRDRKKCPADHPVEFVDINVLGTWKLENISKAGKLLKKPPIPVTFDDEHEMRKVYSLIYDVFRYKHVLIQALKNVAFYAHFPQLKNDEHRVWLMLFELYVRHFLKRPGEDLKLEAELYQQAQVDYIAKSLWNHRIRLAASISRLRIKNGALHLSELLPSHLQDEKVAIAAANQIVCGWVNPFKLKDKEIAEDYLKDIGLVQVDEDIKSGKFLKENQYRWDTVCPLFMSCLPTDRSEFARSSFVRDNYFVLQDRTFTLAPAIFSKLLDHFQLNGDILQTHVSSPRSTAYLAALFHSINRVNSFLAFGAGQNLFEYNDYMRSLGVDNVRIFAENFSTLPLDSPILERVVGIFATPPNSFSGVADPIDLICSRGGDLSMLEVLTESKMSQEGKQRVGIILEEQRETLRLAMSRPQIQFILYETHSIVGTENQDMVQRAIEDVNRCAYEKHLSAYKEKKRLEALAEAELANIPSAALTQSSPRKRTTGGGTTSATTKTDESTITAATTRVRLEKDTMGSSRESNLSNIDIGGGGYGGGGGGPNEDFSQNIKVPKTDEFTVANVPDMCLNQDRCVDFDTLGCFISLIQRKQITKLDAKYLIKMAEARGLFSSADRKKSAKTKSMKKSEKKSRKTTERDSASKKCIVKKDEVTTLVARLNTPTHASMIRSNLPTLSSLNNQSLAFNLLDKTCSRHSKHHGEDYAIASTSALMTTLHLNSRAKKWWQESAKYVNAVRAIEKQNESNQDRNDNYETNLPPLTLSRTHPRGFPYHPIKQEKSRTSIRVPYPVTVRQLEFQGYGNTSQKRLSSRLLEDPGYWTV